MNRGGQLRLVGRRWSTRYSKRELASSLSVSLSEFAARWTYHDIHSITDPTERDERRKTALTEQVAVATSPVHSERNSHTTIYTQTLEHPRLNWCTRRLELWNQEPKARLTVRFHRSESERPEIFFISCNLPQSEQLPETSNGGLPFVPFDDQLPGTCMDYFAIDGWVRWDSPAGGWLWITRDAPLVTFGDHQVLAHRSTPPEHPNRVLAMVFNNAWFTNFVADSHGAMEFQFDLVWLPTDAKKPNVDELAESIVAEPQVVINPDLPADSIFLERLHRPFPGALTRPSEGEEVGR